MSICLRRREFIAGLGGAAAWQPDTLPREPKSAICAVRQRARNGRRRAGILGLVLFIVLAGVTVGAPPAAAEIGSPAADRLAADTARTTASGATFMAPAAWRVTSTANKIVLEPPETDSHLALVDVAAADATEAVAAGWAAYRGDTHRPLRLATAQAPFNGWEERHLYNYETSPNEKAVVYALAWRAGRDWMVVIVEASQSTFEKRNAAFSLVIGSLRPRGYEREVFAGKQAHRLDAERITRLKEFVADLMRQFDIPGVGLSLIDQGKVVFAGGLGVKTLGKPDPVDADTLFLAASNTKALTTLLLAEFVDENRLHWDQRVIEIYPDFQLGDGATTRQVLLKHLVCACTGLPRQDFEWLFNYATATPASSLKSLATMQPTSRFGEVYQYSNLMAAAAGYVGAAVIGPGEELGTTYDAAMRARVFEPLGMTHTTFDFATAMRGNYASPHDDDVDGRMMVARMDHNYSVVPVRPAGGMWTSARDLSQYLLLELALGALPGGGRLVSKENLLERRRAQVQIGEDVAYGMGLVVQTQYGIPVVDHGGVLFGYRSDVIFLPDHGVGAVILTNAETGGYLTSLFRRRLLEVLFDGRPEVVEQATAAVAQRAANIGKRRERLMVPADRTEAGKLASSYVSDALGSLRVRTQDGATIFDFGAWQSSIASRRNDDGTMSFILIDPGVPGFNFVAGERDGKRALIVRDAQHEYAFVESALP
jgi:CubicO group peptidase (beta-lactamase class C family)